GKSLPETLEMENNDKRIEKQTGPEGKKHLPGWGEKKIQIKNPHSILSLPFGGPRRKVSSRLPKVKCRGTAPCGFALTCDSHLFWERSAIVSFLKMEVEENEVG
ncbi:hypothetical protein RUM44_011522, partial [Polyplax serrata]